MIYPKELAINLRKKLVYTLNLNRYYIFFPISYH